MKLEDVIEVLIRVFVTLIGILFFAVILFIVFIFGLGIIGIVIVLFVLLGILFLLEKYFGLISKILGFILKRKIQKFKEDLKNAYEESEEENSDFIDAEFNVRD